MNVTKEQKEYTSIKNHNKEVLKKLDELRGTVEDHITQTNYPVGLSLGVDQGESKDVIVLRLKLYK